MGRTGRNGQYASLRIAGRYRLIERLGTGGMSVVWRGYDEVLGRPVAVKVLSPQLAADQTFRDRLRQEALAAARLSHPHITGIFDFGEAPLSERLTVPYVVMELNDGESVAACLSRRGPLPWREAVTVATEVASALAAAHARGVVHRDVTPANVMLTPAGAKVVDFGISAIVGERDAAPDGSLLGTPAYLAPERLAGAQVTSATDVYALGLLLYRELTGRLPWPAETTAEALRAHLYAAPAPLPALPGMPPAVAELCLRCLAKTPTDRPAAADAARALAATVGLHPIVPPHRDRPADAPPPVRATAPASAAPTHPAPPRSPLAVSWLRISARLGLGRVRPLGLGRVHPLGLGRVRPLGLGRVRPLGLGRVRPLGLGRVRPLGLGRVRPLGGGLFAVMTRRGPQRTRHRLRAALVTAALVAVAGASWVTTREPAAVEQAQAAGAAPAARVPARGVCAVRYRLRRDSGSTYEAVLTVTATGEAARVPWRVQFTYPGTQRLTTAPRTVTQQGRTVVAKGSGRLRTFTLRGTYRGYNPLPLAFTLDGHSCRAEVVGTTTGRAGSQQISEPTAPQERPARGETKHDRPSRKGGERTSRARPAAPRPPSPPPAARTGTGFSLAL